MHPVQYVRLPVKNTYNIRELGGYPCIPHGSTKWHAFLRADDLNRLDSEGIDFLKDYGVTTVIDLRSREELDKSPDPFAEVSGTDYFNIPLVSGSLADITKADDIDSGFMNIFYLTIMQNEKEALRSVMQTVADAEPGCILFHCTAGKDRTGIIAALILGLAGVSDADIVSNYEATYNYIRRNPEMQRHKKTIPEEFIYSKAEYIETVLSYIYESYGSIYSYLLSSGLSEETLEKVTERTRH